MNVAAQTGLGWAGIIRLGLVQTSLGAIVLVVTSTMNRVMVVELALPAMIPGGLVALHYAVQLLRPRLGHGSDVGGRRTPWIVGGMAVLAAGGVLAAVAVDVMTANLAAGIALAAVAFVLVGIGVGACGTALLLLLARSVAPARRPAAATLVWMMMLLGFAVTAAAIGRLLDPFSPARLIGVTGLVAGLAFLVTLAGVWRIEDRAPSPIPAVPASRENFRGALAQVWAEPTSRRFTFFVFAAMFAYSAQELILEPFAGRVLGFTPGASARLAGLLHGGVFSGMLLAAIFAGVSGRGRVGADQMRRWAIGGCVASGLAMLGLAVQMFPPHAMVFGLGVANGCFVTAAISTMMALASVGAPGRDGVRMGLWGAAQAIAFAAGGLSGSAASDLFRHWLGSPALSYSAVFLAEAVLFFVAGWQAIRVFQPAGTALRALPDAVAVSQT